MSKSEFVPYTNTSHNRRPRVNIGKLLSMDMHCQFCNSSNMDKRALSCRDCGTTAPRNYGANQKKDRHGNKL